MKPRLLLLSTLLLLCIAAFGKKVFTETSTATWFIYPRSLGTPPAGWITNPTGVSSAWIPAGIDPCTWAPSATPTSQRLLGSTFTSSLSIATAYFYTTFNVDSLTCMDNVNLIYNADDSAYFWLNGNLIAAGGAGGGTVFTQLIPKSNFVLGQNVLTVILKNKSAGCFFIQAEVSSADGPVIKTTTTNNCAGNPIVLQGVAGAASYKWHDNSTASSFVTSSTGKFWVHSYVGSCKIFIDTFIIVNTPATIMQKRTIQHCMNIPKVLSPDKPYNNATYLWNTGSTNNTLTITKAGTYWLRVKENCLITIDTIKVVDANTSANIIRNDSTICEGDTISLLCTVHPDTAKISWSTGDTTKTIKVYKPGQYSVTANFDGCIATDNFEIRSGQQISIDLGQDKELCTGDVLQLPHLASSEQNDKYLWQDGSTDRKYIVTLAGRYTVKVIGDCNTVYDTVNITTRNCRLLFPDVFSPNGDGRNDIAHMFGDIANVSMFEMHIYHRRGQEVFVSNDITKGWDGTHNGQPAGQDTYNYYIKYKYNGKYEMMKGTLILLR